MVRVSSETCALTWIMVHPEYQRQGCGKAMMLQLFTLAEAARCRKVAVSTSQHADQFFCPIRRHYPALAKRWLGTEYASAGYGNNSAVGESTD